MSRLMLNLSSRNRLIWRISGDQYFNLLPFPALLTRHYGINYLDVEQHLEDGCNVNLHNQKFIHAYGWKYFDAATKKEKAGKKAKVPEVARQTAATLNMDVCVGANYFKTGEDPIIRAEEEYPEWLWDLDPGKQQEPDPDSKQYWRRLRKEQAHRALVTFREKY